MSLGKIGENHGTCGETGKQQGEEYERFVQDVYRVLNANDGLSDVVVQHNVKLKGISREHQIDVYWQFSYGTVTYRVRALHGKQPSREKHSCRKSSKGKRKGTGRVAAWLGRPESWNSTHDGSIRYVTYSL